MSDLYDNGVIQLSILYSKQYRDNAKNFVTCFLKFRSIRTACETIVAVYKKVGAFDECKLTGKDFSEYSNQYKIDEKWKRVLSEILLIIFALLNTAPIANEK